MPVSRNDTFTENSSKSTICCMNYCRLHCLTNTIIATHLCLCCVTSNITAADKGSLEKIKPNSKAKK